MKCGISFHLLHLKIIYFIIELIGLQVWMKWTNEKNEQGRRNEANKIGEMEFGRVRGPEAITHSFNKASSPIHKPIPPNKLPSFLCSLACFIDSVHLLIDR